MMSRHMGRRAAIAMAVLTLASAAAITGRAQEMRTSSTPAMWPPYDRAREVTVTGTIADTETIESPVDGSEFVILNLTVKGEPLHVLAAPAAFIRKSGFALPKGAAITATGFPGSVFRDEPAMTGGRLVVAGKTLELRDPSGKPAWMEKR